MKERLKIKICGMTDSGNVREVSSLSPDFMGFIFYPKSARYVGDKPDPALFKAVPKEIIKTAVFVNESFDKVMDISGKHHIDHLQLHGRETPEMCELLRSSGKTLIKAIPGDQVNDKSSLKAYEEVCDYLLFDTPVSTFGGSGRKFDWSLLEDMDVPKPFFLSGGIGPEDGEELLRMNLQKLFAIDVNSRFELEPGIKDVGSLSSFFKKIRNEA